MADLSDAELAEVRQWVGPNPDDETINTINERLGSLAEVARQILKTRHATITSRLETTPGRWGAQGDYTEDWSTNLTAATKLEAQIAKLDLIILAEQAALLPATATVQRRIGRSDRDRLFGN